MIFTFKNQDAGQVARLGHNVAKKYNIDKRDPNWITYIEDMKYQVKKYNKKKKALSFS